MNSLHRNITGEFRLGSKHRENRVRSVRLPGKASMFKRLRADRGCVRADRRRTHSSAVKVSASAHIWLIR